MIIDKVNIIAFAGIKNKVIDFKEGINLIYGENEKGKSTIQNFIRVWLYGMNSKRSKDIKNNDRLRFMPVDGDTIRGELYLNHNNRRYVIIRTFGKTKKEDLSQIIDAETGEEILDIPKNDPGKYFLNVNSATFNKTLFISQLGVAISKDKEEEIIDKAANLLDSEEENISVQKAFEKLETIKKKITTTRKTGKLDILREKYNALVEERYEAYRLAENNLEEEQALITLKENRSNLREEIKNLNIYKRYLKKIKLQKEYEEITEYLKKKEELKKKERFIESSLSSKNGLIDENLLNDIKEENSLYFSILDMKNESERNLAYKIEIYNKKKSDNRELLFLDNISNNEKNNFIKNVMEQEVIKEKIDIYNNLNIEIERLQEEIAIKKEKLGASINFENKVEEIKYLLKRYEEKLKELKFNIENNNLKEDTNNRDYIKKYNNLIKVASVLLFISLICTIIIKTNIYLSVIIGIAFIFSLLFLLIINKKVNKNKTIEGKEQVIKRLQEEINEIEKEIYKYTKLVKSSSYEDFIRKLKSYEEFTDFEEKQKIRISEKYSQLVLLNIDKLKETYNKNQKNIDKILELSNTENINEIIYKISKYEEVNKELLSLEIEVEKEEKSIESLEKELNIREKRIREKLAFIGLEDIDLYELEEKLIELREKIKERAEIIRGLKSIEETYAALTKDKDIDTIKEEVKDIINKEIKYNYSSEEEIDIKISEKSNELIELEKSIKDIENKLENRYLGKRSIAEIEEEIEDIKEKMKTLEIQMQSIELAIEVMKASLREVRGNFTNILNSNVMNYYNYLTNGEYNEVMVSDSYEMKVRQKNDVISAGMLSNGANDQLYLSLRLAFIKMIYKNTEYPLILDDAFVQYDDMRLEKALKLLSEIDINQIIIFTCQKREIELLKNINDKVNYICL
ncbi:AAA family ATPase [Clostridium isatidis]|uniref:AAA family ATPase n=1 Tax=Clostridium isatidis TaxID=182773 RepID=UPI003AAF690A